ncbi:MAG: CBS domain-containing protein [Alphaproteobacteria bacterium]|nr:CBS domain-containing protein [Alphaproteobacteria bacterium]
MTRRFIPDVVRDQKLVTLGPRDHVRDAARLMRHRHVGSILVLDGEQLVGIFTARDLVFRVAADGLDPDLTPVGKVMTATPDTINSRAAPLDALQRMQERGYRHLPVVDDKGRLTGIVSRRDFLDEERHQQKPVRLRR